MQDATVTDATDAVYETRYGPNRSDLLLLPMAVIFVVIGVSIASQSSSPVETTLGWGATALFGLFVALRIVQWAYRRVALRVDATGVTLGITPPWPASRIASVPWSDVKRIVLWRQPANRTTMRYIGVERVEGAPPLPGSARNATLQKLNTAVAPAHVPEQVVNDSRPISGWRLDEERLARAVAQFAPHVEIVDLG